MTRHTASLSLHGSWLIALLLLAPLGLGGMSLIPQDPVEEAVEEEGPLHDIMEGMKDHMRALRRQLGEEGDKAEAMRHAETLKDLALQALPHCPAPKDGLSAAEQLAWRVGYERKLLQVADGMLQMQVAIQEGDLEAAKNFYRIAGEKKKEGHDTYDQKELPW